MPTYEQFTDAVLSENLSALHVMVINQGYDINARNERGETALICACANNKFMVARWLFDHGADVNLPDNAGATPLDWAKNWASEDFQYWLRNVLAKEGISEK